MRGLGIDDFSQKGLLCAPVANATIVVTSLACCRNRAVGATPVTRPGNLVRGALLSHRVRGRRPMHGRASVCGLFIARKRSLGSINRYTLRRVTMQYC